MIFRHVLSTSFIVVILFSVVHSRKSKRSPPNFSEVVKNISSVNNLLQNVIRNYKELEKIAKSGTDEVIGDQEFKTYFDVETSKRNIIDDTITTSEKSVRTPIFFSDESWREGETDSNEKSASGKEFFDTSPAVSKEHTETGILAVKKKKALGRNFNGDTEPDIHSSLGEISRLKKKVKTSRKPGHKKKHAVSKTPRITNKLISHALKTKPKHPQVKIESDKALLSNSDDETLMKNEVLRADYLREAYMDACRVVAIRRCRRALRATSKDVCSRGRKCTSDFKDDFRQNGITACDAQFSNQSSACRSGVGDDPEVNIPNRKRMRVLIKTRNSRKPIKPHAFKRAKANKTRQFNILRDRYEKACKMDSFKRCRAACQDSYKDTCHKFDCPEAKSNLFKKSCKRRCKESFGVTGGDGDDSSDSDSNSS